MPVYARTLAPSRSAAIPDVGAEALGGLHEVAGAIFELELGNGWVLPVIITAIEVDRPLDGLMRINGRFEAHGAPQRDMGRS